MNTADLHHLAQELDAFGPSRCEFTLLGFARDARAAGLSSVLIDVMVDRSEPDVTRLRAFGRLAVAVDAAVRPTDRAIAGPAATPVPADAAPSAA